MSSPSECPVQVNDYESSMIAADWYEEYSDDATALTYRHDRSHNDNYRGSYTIFKRSTSRTRDAYPQVVSQCQTRRTVGYSSSTNKTRSNWMLAWSKSIHDRSYSRSRMSNK